MRIAILFLLLAGPIKLFAQSSLSITGPSSAYIATSYTYEVRLNGIQPPAGATITWSVESGTIVSAVTNPAAANITCVVQWSHSPGIYSLSATLGSPGQSATMPITVSCRQVNGGGNKTICLGDSVQIGTPAVPGHYSIWGPTASLDNAATAQPFARPAQTTTYRVMQFIQQPPSLMTNGDFENGYTAFGSDYMPYADTTGTTGKYAITTNPILLNPGWRDMTYYGPHGNILVADGSGQTDPSGLRFWYTTVNVQPNNTYILDISRWPLVIDNFSRVQVTLTGNNNDVCIREFEVDPQAQPAFQNWSGYGLPWYSGSSTQVTIDLRYLPVPGNPPHANQLAFDQIALRERVGCIYTADTVIVAIGSPPQLTPAGPIEYYYVQEKGISPVGITLSADARSNYQWYRNGALIEGATAQTYRAQITGTYSVRSGGCPSAGVEFYEHAKGRDNRTVIGQSLDFPAGIFTPSYYCSGAAGFIRQFDLGISANYYWETPASSQLSIDSATYNVHSPQAGMIINGLPAGPTPILGYAELNGYVKAMEFNRFYYSSYAVPQTDSVAICPGSSFNVTNYNSFTSSLINPGSSQFDWETYNVGAGGEIVTPDPALYPDPVDPGNRKKIRIPGRNRFTGNLTVRFNTLPGQVKKYFYSENGDCYQDSKRYLPALGCVLNPMETDGINLYPNPARSTVMIDAPDDIVSIEVMGINNYTTQHTFRRMAGGKRVSMNLLQFRPGIYNCRITTTGGVVNKKLIVDQ